MHTPENIRILCANCGQVTTIANDDPGFGLCGTCEARLNSQKGRWKQGAPTIKGGRETVGAKRRPRMVGIN